jgi:uncharacterized metal-binding protein YceD (DUF177 family)
VKSNRQFIIPFKGLKVGRHDFIFEVDDKFFDVFPESEIKKGAVSIHVFLTKRDNMLEIEFEISGNVWVTCDRCLDEFLLPIEYESNLFVKFGEISEEQSDEIIILSSAETEIDLMQYIYEFIHLSLPYRKVHPNDKKGKSLCNKEMLKKINEYAVHENATNNSNPEWDNLKNILLNNN